MGVFRGSSRTADESEYVLFWAGNTPLYWNRIAAQISTERSLSLTENAHLFGLLNVTMTDAVIACWDSKYRYVFWRPITAIRAGDIDGNIPPLIPTLPGFRGSISFRPAPRPIPNIHPDTPRSAGQQQLSWRGSLVTTQHSR